MASKRQLALTHVAKKRLGLEDDDYRAILRITTGKDSAKDLNGREVDALMGGFEHLGFHPRGASGKDFGKRPGMASPDQVQLIRDLWLQFNRSFEARALDAWLTKTFSVGSIRFVSKPMAGKAIAALRAMIKRQREH